MALGAQATRTLSASQMAFLATVPTICALLMSVQSLMRVSTANVRFRGTTSAQGAAAFTNSYTASPPRRPLLNCARRRWSGGARARWGRRASAQGLGKGRLRVRGEPKLLGTLLQLSIDPGQALLSRAWAHGTCFANVRTGSILRSAAARRTSTRMALRSQRLAL